MDYADIDPVIRKWVALLGSTLFEEWDGKPARFFSTPGDPPFECFQISIERSADDVVVYAHAVDTNDDVEGKLASVEPNAAHLALARLDAEWPGELLIVTQNVDDLHERAGAKRLIHMHGELKSALCALCGIRHGWEDSLPPEAECPDCGEPALRPDIVFFGEMPYQMEIIERALAQADLFVSIGTSGAVYPAAGFVQIAKYHGAETLELNLDPSEGSAWFAESRLGPAGNLVPEWVEEVLGRL